MIKRYAEHAANERTFLAWVRTAVAVMAFGFLVERFDLFMSAAEVSAAPMTVRAQLFADGVALAFIVLGVAMIVVANVRFFRVAKEIDRDEIVHSTGSWFDLVLAALLLLLGVSLILCVPRALLSMSLSIS
jgi:putative membrane protein